MDIERILGIFIARPALALIPAAAFALAYRRSRRPIILAAALVWLAYWPYEQAMKLRILCSGECNIRVDLLLLYPVLALVSVAAGLVAIKAVFRSKHS